VETIPPIFNLFSNLSDRKNVQISELSEQGANVSLEDYNTS